jgi:hypothetical protein
MSALPCPLPNPFAPADQAYEKIATLLSGEASQLSHSDLERQLGAMGQDLLRKLMQAHLEMRQPGQAQEPVRDAAGTTLKPTQVHTRSLETVFGTVEVGRTGYSAAGKKSSLHPLDAALNLPDEKYSLEVRRRVAIEASKASFDEGVETLEKFTGAHVPKRQFEQLTIRAARDFEAFYAERQKSACADQQTDSILVLTVDGKGVTMLDQDLREPTRRAAAERENNFTSRLGRGRRLNAKRMASVAAIYAVEPFVRTPEQVLPEQKPQEVAIRPRPEHKRVWASLARSPQEVITAMFEEAVYRDPKGQKCWVALVDGNETQIRLVEQLAKERNLTVPIVVDFIHVAEYVWEAAKALFPDDKKKQDSWVLKHMREILRGKATNVAAGIRRSATFRKMGSEERKHVDACANYLHKYEPYLHYERALKKGLPIATGVIEGACGYLVEARMNRSGASWSLTGAEAVLRLRALRASGDFDQYWEFHENQEYQRNHAANYADQNVPKVVPPPAPSSNTKRPPALKIVKK